MGKLRGILRILPVLPVIFFFSCIEDEEQIANFSVSKIEGDYTAQLKMDFPGPRPEVSVFGGSATVSLDDADDFTLFVDFPDDYITTELYGTVVEKIVNTSNSALGGISFTVEETSELAPDPDKIDIQTIDGVTKKAYGIFLETEGNNLIMTLYMIEKDESPTEYEFKAAKNLE